MAALNRWQVGAVAGVGAAVGGMLASWLATGDKEMDGVVLVLGAGLGGALAGALAAATPNGVTATTPAQVAAANTAAQGLAALGQ